MEESIYNIVPREYQAATKQQRHVSKFKSNLEHDSQLTQVTKADHRTMGQAKVPMRGPQDFLKKHEREPAMPEKTRKDASDGEKSFKYSGDQRKPPVPKQDEKPIMGLRTTKNFITQNAVENIMSVPKKPEKNYVDTRKGDKHLLEPSGMEPRYLCKKEFGKTPVYLTKRKEEIEAAQEEYNSYVAERCRRGAMKMLSEPERQSILHGLKTNWEEIHHLYQGLSVVTDTTPKKNRKERMEAEMKQLERDIELIEKHRIIYIS